MNRYIRQVSRLFPDEQGQDLVEYALLGLFVGLAGLTAWNAIASALGIAYTGYDSGVQALWEPKNP